MLVLLFGDALGGIVAQSRQEELFRQYNDSSKR